MKMVCVVAVLSFFVFTGNVSAQQKYGHIDSDEILEAMPEYKQLNATLEAKRKQYAAQLQKMYADYQERTKEINDYGAAMMEAVREERFREIDSLQQALAGFQERADSELSKLELKLMKPLNDKYLKIVNAVAKEGGYTYIFDISTGNFSYYPETTGDITDLVKKKMGIN